MADAAANTGEGAAQVVAQAGAAGAGERVTPLAFLIIVPDLRNGTATDIQQAAPKASVSRSFKWVSITGATSDIAVDLVEYYIRGTYAQLLAAAGQNITDATRSEMRKRAIVLGSVRSGAMAALSLTAADMNQAECTTSGYSYANGQILADNAGGTAGGKFPVAQAMPALTVEEVEVIGPLVYLGMVVPVLQGVSLVNSGHHYLPTTKNIFEGTRKQMLGVAREGARVWIEGMGDVFNDMAFHKACHPISPPLKRLMAKNPKIAANLKASGHGAASIRLPALPSEASIGKTAVALVLAAKPVIESMGHTASVDSGVQLIRDLESAAEGRPEIDAVEAIKLWAATNVTSIAFCIGIVADVHERVGTGRNSLLEAYSVKKIAGDNASIVDRGRTYSRAAHAQMRERIEKGQFADPSIMM
jgi:hypothetical protein